MPDQRKILAMLRVKLPRYGREGAVEVRPFPAEKKHRASEAQGLSGEAVKGNPSTTVIPGVDESKTTPDELSEPKLRIAKYRFPDGMRIASVEERRRFYSREFSLAGVRHWFRGWQSPIVFAAVIGRHTGIAPKKYRRERARTIVIDEYESLSEIKNYLIDFKPESAYYDRNVYEDWDQARRIGNDTTQLGRSFGQELVFDVDPENFACPIHGTLEEKMRKHQGLSFCRLEFQLAQHEAVQLLEIMLRKFSDVSIVYSGRGFHIHIRDEETVFWNRKKRLTLARSLSKKGFLMDEWVPAGGMRLIRLPYSLNGLVSRIAIPLAMNELGIFDPIADRRSIPMFLSR